MGKTAEYAKQSTGERETVADRFCTLTNYSGRVRSERLRPRTVLLRGDPYSDPTVRGALESSTHILRQRYELEERVEDGVVLFLFSAQHVAARLHDGKVVCARCASLEEDENGRPHVGLMAHEVQGPLACETCGAEVAP